MKMERKYVLLLPLLAVVCLNKAVLGDSVSCVAQPGVAYEDCETRSMRVIPFLDCCTRTVYSGTHAVEYEFHPGAFDLEILAAAMDPLTKIQIRKNHCNDGSCKIIQIDSSATFPLTIPLSGNTFRLYAGGYQFSLMFRVTNQPSTGCRCPVDCADGWTSFDNSCYKFSDISYGAFELNAHCHILRYGARLTSVHSLAEHDFLKNLIDDNGSPNFTYIGLFDTKEGGAPRGWEWMDGSGYTFQKWHTAQPNDWNGEQDCLEMRKEMDFEWNDWQCSADFPGLCKHGQHRCADGWLRLDENCYQLTTNKGTFANMEDYCGSLHPGSHLVSVHSADEHAFLRDIMIANGLREEDAWVGLFDIKEGDTPRGWEWTDGSAYDSQHWHGNQPNDFNDIQDCVEMSPNHGYNWNDINCGRQNLALCKYSLPQCPAGWSQFQSSCYQVNTTTDGFNNLEALCAQATPHADAHLSSVHSEEEHIFIKALLKTKGISGDVWIGLYDIKEGETPRGWEWTDGSTFDFDKWYGGSNAQPNDYNGNQDCLEMRNEFDYEWNDRGCGSNLPGVCKFNL